MRGELSQAGGVRPEVPHSTTWTLPAKRSGPQSRAQPGLRTRAGVQASLAQNILHSSGRRGWRTWVTGDVGSSPASSLRRQKRLKVKCPPRACPLSPTHPQVPRGSRARRQLGPRAQRGASTMNGSLRAPLCPRQALLLRPRLTVPGGGGGSGGGRGRRSGAGRAGAVRLLFAPRHPDGKGGESGTVGKTLKVTL